MALSLVAAELTGAVLETVLYGAFVVIFMIYIIVTLCSTPAYGATRPGNKLTAIAASVLFVSTTAHWIVTVFRLYQAFMPSGDSQLVYYGRLTDPMNVAKNALYVFQTFIGDFIMIYRLYCICERRAIICLFPILSTIAFIASGVGISYQFSHAAIGDNIFQPQYERWVVPCFLTSVVTNVYSTSFIAHRIWRNNRNMKQIAPDITCNFRDGVTSLQFVLLVVVESAIMYTMFSLTIVISYLVKSNFQFLALEASSPALGIVFCLIILRIRLEGCSRSWKGPVPATDIRLSPLTVRVSRSVHVDDQEYTSGKRPEGRMSVLKTSSDHDRLP